MQNSKPLIASNTFWFGVIQIAFGIIGLVFHFLDTATGSTLIVTGLGTIGFRTGTSLPIGGIFHR